MRRTLRLSICFYGLLTLSACRTAAQSSSTKDDGADDTPVIATANVPPTPDHFFVKDDAAVTILTISASVGVPIIKNPAVGESSASLASIACSDAVAPTVCTILTKGSATVYPVPEPSATQLLAILRAAGANNGNVHGVVCHVVPAIHVKQCLGQLGAFTPVSP